jgi:protein-tyrosine phosphatase
VIDFHNHLMPGVDDGAVTDEEAEAGLGFMWAEGIRALVATPHVDGSVTERPADLIQRLAELDEGWQRLCAVGAARYPQLKLYRGAEVALDAVEPDVSDERLRLAGGPFVLVEFPYMSVPPHSSRVLTHIAGRGYQPIIAHPERYANMTPESRLPAEWRSYGALLQVNAGSLSGRYGTLARANVLSLLQRGEADYLCSDYHARGHPASASAHRLLLELNAGEQADLLMRVNPQRMLDGQPPIPVTPLQLRRSLSARVRGWFK